MIGTALGPYKILESIGAGGMGEVFLGEDTRLGRKVAIKVLPAEFVGMPDRLARFEQEARSAAALNHPHIAVVHDIGHEVVPGAEDVTGESTVHFMVQEYLEGHTLRTTLDAERMPLKRALDLGVEVCEGLAAAHAAGIIHRDLKPANIFVTKEGHTKILDFGLAKLTELSVLGTSSGPEVSASPTVLGTVAGQVLGTAGYMAPEQVAGEELDERADIFSFGCVLYEMVSGKRAFDGETVLDTLHSIARAEPQSLSEIDARLPAELQRILKKCLAKDRNLRYQGPQDLVVDLRALAVEVEAGRALPVGASMAGQVVEGIPAASGGGDAAPGRGVRWLLAVPAAIVLVAAASLITWFAIQTEPPPLTVKRFIFDLPEGQRLIDDVRPFALSPDGRQIVYSAFDAGGIGLYLRSLDQLEGRAVVGTGAAEQPFFSFDGNWIGFFQDGELKKVAAAGGQPLALTGLDGQNYVGADWGEDDTIVFSSGGGPIKRVQAAGGTAEPITEVDTSAGEVFHSSPHFLPGGDAILYTIFHGTTAPATIAVLDLETGDSTTIIEPGAEAVYLPTGHIVYGLDGSLWAASFDPEQRVLTGQPAPIVNGVGMFPSLSAAASIADDGTLFYLEGGSTMVDEVLVWLDVNGGVTNLPDPPRQGEVWTPRLSPDGRRVAFRLDDVTGERNIWVMDLERGISSLLTPNGGARSFAWTPDGEWIYYSSDERDLLADRSSAGAMPAREAETAAAAPPAEGGLTGSDVYRRRADMSAPPEEVLIGSGNQLVRSISPDGEWVLFANTDALTTGQYDIELLSINEGGDPRKLFASPERETTGNFSPDGRWLAFAAETTGQQEIYVQSFPNLGGLIQVSRDGGGEPTWSKDGSKLYFRSIRNQDLYVVDVIPGDPIGFSVPEVVTPNIFVGLQQNAGSFDVSDDPERLVFVRSRGDEAGAEPSTQLTVVINWFEELRRLMAASGS